MRIDLNSQYIHAEPIGEIKNKPAWAIINSKSDNDIACVNYSPAWRRYVMTTDTPAVFDIGCLESIIKFIRSRKVAISESGER